MSGNHFDVIVIGTGPAGEGAAMKAVKVGKRVAVMERFEQVGGGCTHWGTIPSKALRRAINYLNITYGNPLYHRMEMVPTYSFPELLSSAEHVIAQQTEMRLGFYEHNKVQLLHGHGQFVDPHTVELLKADGGVQTYTADAFVIATGSRPYRPKDVDFNHPRIFDSDKLLSMNFTPRSVTIYGAGVVGCEYASMLARMKMEVTLVNTRDKLLAFLDDEIIAALAYHFSEEEGVLMRHGEEYERIEGMGEGGDGASDGVVLHLKSGKQIRSDILLWANGRSGNTENLGLEKLGVVPNRRGGIEVNEKLQVKINAPGAAGGGGVYEHIYAAGDVIGEPSLASASYDQGRFAATEWTEGRAEYKLLAAVPTGIYTTPEISSLGKTEEELTADKVPYEVGKSYFKHLARAQIRGQQVGMLKLLFHSQTLALLGIHCFGENASEIIHIGQAIMTQPAPHNTIWYFVHTTFNYPTMAEAYRVAALNGLDRVDEAIKRKAEVDGQKP